MARYLAILLTLSLVALGCSDDKGPTGTVVQPTPDTGGSNNSQIDAGDTGDTGCQGPGCDGPSIISDGECEIVHYLGVLDVEGDAVTMVGDTTGMASGLTTGCALEGDNAVEYVFGFRVSESAFVDLEIRSPDQVDWVHEVREGNCTAEGAIYCRDPETSRFLARKDTTYFVVVEPNQAAQVGAVEVDLEFTPVICDVLGARHCEDGNLVICEGGLAETPYACAESCDVGTCAGDLCDGALPVSGTGRHTFEGHLEAYTNAFDAKDRESCNLNGALETPGAEVVFSLASLMAGQVVTIDASEDQNDNAILVLPSCGGQDQCLAAGEIGNRLEWTVPDDGDYIVIIDSLSELSKPFLYHIDID